MRRGEIISRSAEETEHIGYCLAPSLPVPGVVLLRGSLGSGKTTLARGIAHGLGLKDRSLVSSPSFTLVNIYQARCPVYHVDLYRLAGERDLYTIGLDEFLGQDGVTIVEWGERLPSLPEGAVMVELEDAGGDTRIIRVLKPDAKPGSGHSRKKRPGRIVQGKARSTRRKEGV